MAIIFFSYFYEKRIIIFLKYIIIVIDSPIILDFLQLFKNLNNKSFVAYVLL